MTGNRVASAAAASGMFLFGLSTTLLGAVLPLLAHRLHFDLAQAGTLFLTLNLGVFLCVFGLGRWIDRRGLAMPMTAGPLLVAAALEMVSAAPGFPALLAAALVLGLGGGALNVATNTLVAVSHPDPRRKNSALNWLGIFFGLGGLSIPLGLGALLGRAGLAPILHFAALLGLAAAAYSFSLSFPSPSPAGPPPPRAPGRGSILILTAALLFLQSGVEAIVGGFSTLFLSREFGLTAAAASWGLTLMWVAVVVARIALVRLALRVSGHRLVLASTAATLLGCAWLLAAQGPAAAFAALSLVGAGLAGVFPTVLGMTSAVFRESSGAVFGLVLTVSCTGAMAMPFAAGRIGQSSGIRAVVWMAIAGTLAIAACELARHSRVARSLPPPPLSSGSDPACTAPPG